MKFIEIEYCEYTVQYVCLYVTSIWEADFVQ